MSDEAWLDDMNAFRARKQHEHKLDRQLGRRRHIKKYGERVAKEFIRDFVARGGRIGIGTPPWR